MLKNNSEVISKLGWKKQLARTRGDSATEDTWTCAISADFGVSQVACINIMLGFSAAEIPI